MPSIAANWESDKFFGDNPLVVQFTDTSEAVDTTITTWAWDFGDGHTSAEQNPLHAFTDPGDYTVSLEVGDGSITDELERTGYIQVSVAEMLPRVAVEVTQVLLVISNLLHWSGYGNANENTVYIVLSDADTSGTFLPVGDPQDATEREVSSGIYRPFISTLADTIGANDRSLALTPTPAPFEDGALVAIDGEATILGGESGNTNYYDVQRGVYGTVRRSHTANAAVYQMHETLEVTNVGAFFSRHVVRYRVVTVSDDGTFPAAEGLAIYPTPVDTGDFCMVYGIVQDIANDPVSGITVRCEIVGEDIFNIRTGEVFSPAEVQTATSDADGYWQVVAPRDVVMSQARTVKLTINDREFFLTVPDRDSANYLECI